MALPAVVASLTRRVALVNTKALGSAMNVTNIYCHLTISPSDPSPHFDFSLNKSAIKLH